MAANVAKLPSCCAGRRDKRGVTTVAARTFTTVRATSAYTPMPEYRRNALSDVMGQ